MKNEKVGKTFANQYYKEENVKQIRNLKEALKYGLVLNHKI